MPIAVDQKSFHAILDKMPGKPHTLTVTGTGEAPTTGWTVKLEPARPPGINPQILILDVVATPPQGTNAKHVTKVDLKYEEKPAHRDYTEVTIRNGTEHFNVKVEIVV